MKIPNNIAEEMLILSV